VLTIEQPTAEAMLMSQSYRFVDPTLLKEATDLYTLYCQVHPDKSQRRQPIGVVMNRHTRRGKLIFSSYPLLLPEECFVTIQELETDFN
jgi:hypothetical protein